jgi:predicted nucleotidyltransferase component of viral defense system
MCNLLYSFKPINTFMAGAIGMEQIKKWAIIALASDDFLMETLVLKGGNAIDLLQPTSTRKLSRASYDLDFSIENDFDEDLAAIAARIEKTIKDTFAEKDLIIFDYKFTPRPKVMREDIKDFWGGYYIEFKLITAIEFNRLEGNLDKIRRGAIAIRPNQSSKVEIEISKYEYVGGKIEKKVDGHTIYIYSPEMIVFEKLRAICQQFPAYSEIIPSHSPRPRARDFYDIHLIYEQHEIDVNSSESKELVGLIFEAKKVPLSFIDDIERHAAIHRQDWQNVIDTLPASEKAGLRDFDYYLSFVGEKFKPLTSL